MSVDTTARLITADTLRAVDREYRDLVMSLRALAALLHEPAPADRADSWEPVLANILDAELNQLAVLMGDVTTALRVENDVTGPRRQIDLSRVLETAVRRTGSRVLVAVADPVQVAAHPEIVTQAIISALSLALRSAEGRVIATSKSIGRDGVVTITVPIGGDAGIWNRLDGRIALLRKIVSAEGGRVTLEHREDAIAIRLAFHRAEESVALRPA